MLSLLHCYTTTHAAATLLFTRIQSAPGKDDPDPRCPYTSLVAQTSVAGDDDMFLLFERGCVHGCMHFLLQQHFGLAVRRARLGNPRYHFFVLNPETISVYP